MYNWFDDISFFNSTILPALIINPNISSGQPIWDQSIKYLAFNHIKNSTGSQAYATYNLKKWHESFYQLKESIKDTETKLMIEKIEIKKIENLISQRLQYQLGLLIAFFPTMTDSYEVFDERLEFVLSSASSLLLKLKNILLQMEIETFDSHTRKQLMQMVCAIQEKNMQQLQGIQNLHSAYSRLEHDSHQTALSYQHLLDQIELAKDDIKRLNLV